MQMPMLEVVSRKFLVKQQESRRLTPPLNFVYDLEIQDAVSSISISSSSPNPYYSKYFTVSESGTVL